MDIHPALMQLAVGIAQKYGVPHNLPVDGTPRTLTLYRGEVDKAQAPEPVLSDASVEEILLQVESDAADDMTWWTVSPDASSKDMACYKKGGTWFFYVCGQLFPWSYMLMVHA